MERKKMLDTVVEREDKLIAAVKKEQSKNVPVYIYGAGLGAKNVESILQQNGLTHAGMLVDKKYLGGGGILFRRYVGESTRQDQPGGGTPRVYCRQIAEACR